MTDRDLQVQPWMGEEAPSEADLRRTLDEEGLAPYRWSNGPGDVYGAHTHPYHKVIYVVRGSITFGLPGQRIELQAGDRLELPGETRHDAVVGPDGVVCLEAHRR
ncbi:MAG: cupin domain-containing protein [Anaerolineae bacterium]|jgi:quercetin dioxygenase-like cupin family protein